MLFRFFLPILLLASNLATAQWFWQNPLPIENMLTSIFFTDPNTGWAVGDAGTIIKTVDGGTNWIAQSSGTTNDLRSVYFTDSNTGWIVGRGGTIVKTINGGTNWVEQSDSIGLEIIFSSVYFTDSNTGWAVGGHEIIGGIILKTQTEEQAGLHS